MRLLIITQALDLDDPVLSVYHDWVAALANVSESVEAVCLKEGRRALQENVIVHSLGKETGPKSRLVYAWRFLALAWRLRSRYDAVFVHMNQEYVLIGGPLWKLLGKQIYLWRNHYSGSVLTDVAALWCTAVFCTSKRSYTAKYAKTVRMPVGVNTDRFVQEAGERVPRSLLLFSRIAPSKHVDLFVEALGLLKERGVVFVASIVGSAPPEFEAYAAEVKERSSELGLSEQLRFLPGVLNEDAPLVYRLHEIYVNCSPSGMLDKMIFEAAASGCLLLTESEDMQSFGFEDVTYDAGDVESLASHMEHLLNCTDEERAALRVRFEALVKAHSLTGLARTLVAHMESAGSR
jgi:glycosyltransferase involved in cell wall biosynthesis